MEEKKYLTIAETSVYLGLAVSYLYKLTAKKEIPFYTPTGKKILFKRAELDEWVESHRVTPTAELESRVQLAAIK